jgi:2-polyprenyl-3-methyl-5-hydroxy-6-metoxy-1,4-benzoquinol methylase
MELKKAWQSRWQDGTTGWDLGMAHPSIAELLELSYKLAEVQPGFRAYVPGCGRGHEGAFLANAGFNVVAADFVEEAIAEAKMLYDDNTKLNFKVEDALIKQDKESFDLVFDRAMLCALQAANRQAYLDAVVHRLKPGGLFMGILFSSIDDQVEKGPPFALSRDELWDLFSPSFSLVYCEQKKAQTLPIIKSEWLVIWRKMTDKVGGAA